MTSAGDRGPRTVWIGPGPRLDALAPLVAALGAEIVRGRAAELASAAIAPSAVAPPSIVLLDAAELGDDDLLDVRRFLERASGARVLLLGEDASRRGVRALLRRDDVRWTSWPPDVEDIHAIAASASTWSGGERPARASSDVQATRTNTGLPPLSPGETADDAGRNAVPRSPLASELAEIERVLGARAGSRAHDDAGDAISRAPDDRALARARDDERELPDRASARPEFAGTPPSGARASEPVPSPPASRDEVAHAGAPIEREASDPRQSEHARATGTAAERGERSPAEHERAAAPASATFRAQVADLADIAQRIELSLHALRDALDGADGDGASLDDLSGEVARLIQFARTLGYVVSPPGPGAQIFDLTEMLEVFLSEIRAAGPDAPRCLLRSNGALRVRSDRQLLSQAFDALFFMARSAAGKGEIVRVQARRDEDEIPAAACVAIDFPAGRLREIAAAAMLEPYALRSVLPDLGPNALAAAVRIIEGQGGRCRLEPAARGRLEWTVVLPLAPGADPGAPSALQPDVASTAAPRGAGSPRADDPFA